MSSKATERGMAVPCPKCGAPAGLVVRVCNLTLGCDECTEDISRADLEVLLADVKKLIAWLDAAGA